MKMKKEECIRIPKRNRKTISINIRISPHVSEWLTKNYLSPSQIWNEAIKELGYKE